MSTPDRNSSLEQQFLYMMHNRPNEDIVGTPEWTEKVFRLAAEREAAEKRMVTFTRNASLGLIAVAGAIFGINEVIHVVSEAMSTGVLVGVGGPGLGGAIGAQLSLRHY